MSFLSKLEQIAAALKPGLDKLRQINEEHAPQIAKMLEEKEKILEKKAKLQEEKVKMQEEKAKKIDKMSDEEIERILLVNNPDKTVKYYRDLAKRTHQQYEQMNIHDED